MAELLRYGETPVPYTASWTYEETFYLSHCRFAGRRAICQNVERGLGKPLFGKPHSQRQREVIAEGLCDLCARSLAARTKVSLSHAAVRLNGADGPAVLQVEPLLHRECAMISMRHCPSLRRDVGDGSLRIRQVTRYRVQIALMDAVYVETITGLAEIAAGHAKVELLGWRDRDVEWLGLSA